MYKRFYIWKRIFLLLLFCLSFALAGFAQENTGTPEEQWLEKARDALAQEHYGEAINFCNQGLAEHPQSSGLYVLRGVSYYVLDVYDKAEADYTKALTIDDKLLVAYMSRAFIYMEQEDYDKAIADFSSLIDLSPNATYYNNRASVYKLKGDFEKAKDDYTKAIELEPQENFYNNRGSLYQENKLYDEAVEDFTQAITINGEYVPAYKNRADVYSLQGIYDKALEDYKKALTIDGDDYYIWYSLAYHYQLFGQNKEAVAAWRSFLQYAPKTEEEKIDYAKKQMEFLK